MTTTANLNIVSPNGFKAKVLVIADAPSQAVWERGQVMHKQAMSRFAEAAHEAGLQESDFGFITPCTPIPEEIAESANKVKAHIEQYGQEFDELVQQFTEAKCVLVLGKTACHQFYQKPVQVTKIRGRFTDEFDTPVMPLLSPNQVCRLPQLYDIFRSDFAQVGQLAKVGWNLKKFQKSFALGDYKVCYDLNEYGLLKNPPELIAADTETRGLSWIKKVGILTIHLSWAEGQGIAIPIDCDYDKNLTPKMRDKLLGQLRTLFANKRVKFVGHNFKFDLHMLRTHGLEVANWFADTMQMVFAVDENMQLKNLKEAARRWLPSIAGFSDEFDDTYDKSKMWEVPLEEMVKYGCGDTDATLRLYNVLQKLLEQDLRQLKCFELVQMPALRGFFEMEETGIKLDTKALDDLGVALEERVAELYEQIIAMVPAKVRRRYIDKGMNLGSDPFMRDVLFSEDGLNLTPVIFTKTTRRSKVEEDKVPSTSAKEHLIYFEHEHPMIPLLIEYAKTEHMRTSFVGKRGGDVFKEIKLLKSGELPKRIVAELEEAKIDPSTLLRRVRRQGEVTIYNGASIVQNAEGTFCIKTQAPDKGFWKYLTPEEKIHPSLNLNTAVTGRTNSKEPNAQNFPKHGKIAKRFRAVFKASEGYTLIEADLSQIELRLAAWVSGDPTMLAVFRAGGDIHAATAATVMQMTAAEFGKLTDEVRSACRSKAKAVNFGLLYGQGWKGFKIFARQSYQVVLTDDEAMQFRDRYFAKYASIKGMHDTMKRFVREHGYVRSLHGALRRLPAIYSNDEAMQAMAERQAINSPIQRFGSDLGLLGVKLFTSKVPRPIARPIMFVHDSNVLEARTDVAEKVAATIKWCMQNVPLKEMFGLTPPIPLLSDVSIGQRLDNMVERKDIKAHDYSDELTALFAKETGPHARVRRKRSLVDILEKMPVKDFIRPLNFGIKKNLHNV